MTAPSYHNLYVTTAKIQRTRIFDLPYGLEVTCTRSGGWQLWRAKTYLPTGHVAAESEVVAEEYAAPGKGLRLDVDGHVIVDSLVASLMAAESE